MKSYKFECGEGGDGEYKLNENDSCEEEAYCVSTVRSGTNRTTIAIIKKAGKHNNNSQFGNTGHFVHKPHIVC